MNKQRKIITAVILVIAVCAVVFLAVRFLGGSSDSAENEAAASAGSTSSGQADASAENASGGADTAEGSKEKEEGEGSASSAGDASASAAEGGSLDTLTEKLAAGGKSLAPEYAGGEYGTWGVEEAADGLRDYYTDTENAKSVTWMFYCVGSNLESKGGNASKDLQEIISSGNGENLKIAAETGGAFAWEDSRISADEKERWLIQDGDMKKVGSAGSDSMVTEESLKDFIVWAKDTYPADRYILTLWDHGGGTMGGFGTDEYYPEDGLSLAEIAGAVTGSGIKLDIMSFDACLMGTLETAYSFEPCADYLLASEETEPGTGWYYTDAMAELSKRPSMPTVELGARLIDDYGKDNDNEGVTLSLVDLREIPVLYESYSQYSGNAKDYIKTDSGFRQVSKARRDSRSYADGENEQIDLADYVRQTSVAGGAALLRRIFSAVKYRNKSDMDGSYGLAVYFPYTQPEAYETVRESLDEIDCTGAEPFYNDFLSVMASGDSGSEDTLTQITGYQESSEDLTGETWYSEFAADTYDYNTLGDGELSLNFDEAENAYTLTLPDEEWDLISDIQLHVLLDDGEGFIELGSDQQYNFTDSGALKADFDNNWTSLDGQAVAFYALPAVTDDDMTIYSGTVPAVLNGEEDIDIYLAWYQDEDGNTESEVLGYLPAEEREEALSSKGYFEFAEGDAIQPTCDYYTYDGNFDDSYDFGEVITVGADGLTIGTASLGEMPSRIWMQLTDLYQQEWYTEDVNISYQ